MVSRRSLLLIASALLAAACLSPTLPPLPPPGQPALVKPMGDGEVLVEGELPVQEAKLLLLNRATEEISGKFVHDGAYSVLIRAEKGDRIDLWYSTLGVDSPVTGFNVGVETSPAPSGTSETP
ncbi:MAG TPA: hypothetical protein VHM70_08960 [Polyangiaceae bacterium]|jgi:hypothetical protein|nr:hypothetical protein [Polyangiaceae bacterium]